MPRAAVVLAVSLLAAASAAAQTPRAELFGGYAFMHDTDRSEDFGVGWLVAAAGNINSWIGISTELGGSYGTCEDCQRGPFVSQRFRGTDLDLHIYTYLAGPRVVARTVPVVTPFAQLLVGGSHVGGGIEWDGALNTGFTWQPGGGVDVAMTPQTGLRFQADYRVIRTQGRHNRQVRLAGGLVWTFGAL
jgi:hypothetical protein